jgi:hypothetical protein
MDSKNYVPMCQSLRQQVAFTENSPVPSPEGSPFDAIKLIQVVRADASLLPAPYRDEYLSRLVQALPDVAVQLKQQEKNLVRHGWTAADAMAEVKSITDTLVGAVRDWGEPAYHEPLTRFEAVVSNLYRSFLSAEQRRNVGLPLIETVPPLVTFAATPEAGPFTLPSDSIRRLTGAAVGVVSLPGSYAPHPLLWPALAHETGGHDVLHADPGLLHELADGAQNLEGVPTALGRIWTAWMDEAASDVYGILNIGPSFVVSLAAFFAALRNAAKQTDDLGTIATILPVSNGQLLDPHPVDLLRLFLAMGVVESLEGLSVARRAEWINLIADVAAVAGGGATSIEVYDVTQKQVLERLPLETMSNAARRVGAYIATARLAALKGHSVQDIETWDDDDETAAGNIAAVAAETSIVALGDDAQLLAGATMAFLANPQKYGPITTNLSQALDDSFARDPIFGTPAARSALALKRRPRARPRTPASPHFPLTLLSA